MYQSILQLDDLFYSYPSQDADDIQIQIARREEFRELAPLPSSRDGSPFTSPPGNKVPGTLFPHQKLIQRLMLPYDRLLLIHRAGTGKSCSAFGVTESIKAGIMVDIIETYIKNYQNNIRRFYVIVRGSTIERELRRQLSCRCTKYEYINLKAISSSQKSHGLNISLSRIQNSFYTFIHINTFGKYFSKFTPEEIYNCFNDSIVIVDEIHFITSSVFTKKINFHNLIEELNTLGSISSLEEEEESEESVESPSKAKSYMQGAYLALYRIGHLMKRSKMLLLTATPMVNDYIEVAYVMNLLLPVERTLFPEIISREEDATIHVLAPYFKGLISYVREVNPGVIVRYQGERQGEDIVKYYDGEEYRVSKVLYASTMSDFQSQAYLTSWGTGEGSKGSTSLFSRQLSSATFVFPDGRYGKATFESYMMKDTSYKYPVFVPRPPYVESMSIENLSNLSIKMYNILALIEDPENPHGIRFVSTEHAYIAFLLGYFLMQYGYEPFNNTGPVFTPQNTSAVTSGPILSTSVLSEAELHSREARICGEMSETIEAKPIIPKAKRYAVLTSSFSMTENMNDAILEAVNHPLNANGDYIKVVIGTPAVQTGISIFNVTQIHILQPRWNSTSTYQAISRGIRALGHTQLKNYLERTYQTPNPTIYVDVYQHAASIDSEKYDLETVQKEFPMAYAEAYEKLGTLDIDFYVYGTAVAKDLQINHIERVMKMMAIDCFINYHRNILPPEYDFSAECNYTRCKYICYNGSPEVTSVDNVDSVIYDSYINLYMEDIKKQSIEAIQDFLSINSTIDLLTLEKEIELNDVILQYVLEGALRNEYYLNKYGMACLVSTEGPYIFLHPIEPSLVAPEHATFPMGPFPHFSMTFYSQNLYYRRPKTLIEYTREIQKTHISSQLTSLNKYTPGTPEFVEALYNLNFASQLHLLEDALYRHDVLGDKSPFVESILQAFSSYIFRTKLIPGVASARGRKAPPTRLKVNPEGKVLPESVEILKTAQETPEYVILHTFASRPEENSAYDILSKYVNPRVIRRLDLSPKGEPIWTELTGTALTFYNALIQTDIIDKVNAMRQRNPRYDIYGYYYASTGRFFYVDTSLYRERNALDARTMPRGVQCTEKTEKGKSGISRTKSALVALLYRLEILPGEELYAPVTEEEAVAFLAQFGMGVEGIVDDPVSLRFYYYMFHEMINGGEGEGEGEYKIPSVEEMKALVTREFKDIKIETIENDYVMLVFYYVWARGNYRSGVLCEFLRKGLERRGLLFTIT